jgi:ribosomal protein S18 acetylase RimI-like enzyme
VPYDDGQLKHGAWRSIVAFQRLLGRYGPGATLLEHDDFVASAVPVSRGSLINAVAPRPGARIAPHLGRIAEFFAHTPKWGVWLDPEQADDAEALQAHGLVLDSNPVLMAAPLAAIDTADGAPAEPITPATVGQVNEAAYGNPPGILTKALSPLPTHEVHAYGVRADETVVSAALIADTADDAFVTFVATRPDHRGRRHASNLLKHALDEARRRGRTTTSLQASKLGQNLYVRLGYRPLGEIHLYEQRSR